MLVGSIHTKRTGILTAWPGFIRPGIFMYKSHKSSSCCLPGSRYRTPAFHFSALAKLSFHLSLDKVNFLLSCLFKFLNLIGSVNPFRHLRNFLNIHPTYKLLAKIDLPSLGQISHKTPSVGSKVK